MRFHLTYLVGDEDMNATGLDHVDRVVRFAYLEQVVVGVYCFGLHVLAHFKDDLLIEVAEHSSNALFKLLVSVLKFDFYVHLDQNQTLYMAYVTYLGHVNMCG